MLNDEERQLLEEFAESLRSRKSSRPRDVARAEALTRLLEEHQELSERVTTPGADLAGNCLLLVKRSPGTDPWSLRLSMKQSALGGLHLYGDFDHAIVYPGVDPDLVHDQRYRVAKDGQALTKLVYVHSPVDLGAWPGR
jgi:hypothetical protein